MVEPMYDSYETDSISNDQSSEKEASPAEIREYCDELRPTSQIEENEINGGMSVKFSFTDNPDEILLDPSQRGGSVTALIGRKREYDYLRDYHSKGKTNIRVPNFIKQRNDKYGHTYEYIGGISFDPVGDFKNIKTHHLDSKYTVKERARALTPEIRYKALGDLILLISDLEEKEGIGMPDFKADMITYYKGEVVLIDSLLSENILLKYGKKKFYKEVIQLLGGRDLLGDKSDEIYESIRDAVEKANAPQNKTPRQDTPREILKALNKYYDSEVKGIPFKKKDISTISEQHEEIRKEEMERTKILASRSKFIDEYLGGEKISLTQVAITYPEKNITDKFVLRYKNEIFNSWVNKEGKLQKFEENNNEALLKSLTDIYTAIISSPLPYGQNLKKFQETSKEQEYQRGKISSESDTHQTVISLTTKNDLKQPIEITIFQEFD